MIKKRIPDHYDFDGTLLLQKLSTYKKPYELSGRILKLDSSFTAQELQEIKDYFLSIAETINEI